MLLTFLTLLHVYFLFFTLFFSFFLLFFSVKVSDNEWFILCDECSYKKSGLRAIKGETKLGVWMSEEEPF